MKVCIDIQPAITQRAGVGRYTKSLVEHLGSAAGADHLRLFYFDFKRRGVPFAAPGAEQRAVQWCPGRLVQRAWKTLDWPPYNWFAGKADVYHFPNFILPPLTRGRSVVTVHDVSFLRHPETTESRNLRYLTSQIHHTVRRADAIITDSHFSAAEIEELLAVPRAKLFPIHLGLDPGLRRPGETEVERTLAALGVQPPYLLHVGTMEPRKNVSFLVEVFEHLTGFEGSLVIAGMRGWKVEPILARIAASTRRERIRHLDFVPDAQLPALYAGAEALVFPSLYEGFGFPPLEAMACGTPVVSSTAGSLPEVLGEAAVLVEGFSAPEWAAAVTSVLDDPDTRQRLQQRGLEHARTYSWQDTAAGTWDVYRRVGS